MATAFYFRAFLDIVAFFFFVHFDLAHSTWYTPLHHAIGYSGFEAELGRSP